MATSTRTIVVDDADPQITWTGPWIPLTGVAEEKGNNGPAFLQTLHEITGNGSLSFSFQGTRVMVWGTVVPHLTPSGPDPFWRCLLNGRDIGPSVAQYPTEESSKSILCSTVLDVPLGDYTIQLDSIVHASPLWVDHIEYDAAPLVQVGSNWTKVPYNDESITYSSGWSTRSGFASATFTTGASMSYDFTGDGILWAGYTPEPLDENAGPGVGFYTIDGVQPPTSFVIPSRPGIRWFYQPYFNVSGLKPGRYRLNVTNGGDASTLALGVFYIYTKNSPASAIGNSSTFPNDTPSDPSSGSSEGKSSKAGVIGGAVGGGIGAILLVVLIVLGVRWFRRRHGKGQLPASDKLPASVEDGPQDAVPQSQEPGTLSDKLTEENQQPGGWGPRRLGHIQNMDGRLDS